MIEIEMLPASIQTEVVTELQIILHNTGNGVCTQLIGDLDLPPSLVLLKGTRRIELARLAPGESHVHTLAVRGRQAGRIQIPLRGFSYRGADGRTRSVEKQALTLQAAPGGAAPVAESHRLEVALSGVQLVAGEWGSLEGRVTNIGSRSISGLVVRVDGPVEGEAASLEVLSPGRPVAFALSVRTDQLGSRVPALLQIASPTGSVLFNGKIYLNVAARQAAANQPGTLVIQDSQVELTYGNRSQLNIGGDAVITGSQIGVGGSAPGPPKCPNCGRPVARTARFCEACGQKLAGV